MREKHGRYREAVDFLKTYNARGRHKLAVLAHSDYNDKSIDHSGAEVQKFMPVPAVYLNLISF